MTEIVGLRNSPRCFESFAKSYRGSRSCSKDRTGGISSSGASAFSSGLSKFDGGISTCSSTSIVEDLFSKAKRLIESGKNRQICEPSGRLDSSVISKYACKSDSDSVQKLDSRVEAIIRKYSNPSNSFTESYSRHSKQPMYPISSSPLSFKPTYAEGYCNTGNKCSLGSNGSIGSLSTKATFDSDKKNLHSDKDKGDTRACVKREDRRSPQKTGMEGNNIRTTSAGAKISSQLCHQNKKRGKSKPKQSTNKSSNKSAGDRPSKNCECPCVDDRIGCQSGSHNSEPDQIRVDCGDKTYSSPCKFMQMDGDQDPCEFPCKGRRSSKGAKKKQQKNRHRLMEEAKKAYKENQRLKLEGLELRQEMECTRKSLMIECAKVLHSVLSFCEERSKKTNAAEKNSDTKPKSCGGPCPQSRKGAGCSTGGCGGYTPSGANKMNAIKGAEVSDCLPPRVPIPPCPPKGCDEDNQCQQEGQDAVISGVVDCNMCPSVRILGEMAFQLERRILEYVFGAEGKNKRRFYGYTVSNVCYMITKESTVPSGKTDNIGKSDKACRFEKIMCALQKYGYNVKIHPEFSQNIVNKFGVLACPPDQCTIDTFRLQDPSAMSGLISKLCGSPSEVASLNIILRCLAFLARCDGKPMFVW